MKILAIDTVFAAIGVAVLDHETGEVWRAVRETERGQAEYLIPMIEEVMKQARIDYTDLGLIAADIGPGSFTGIRIGIAAARGIALAAQVPLQGVLSTDALYATWTEAGGTGPVHAVINTKRDDLFLRTYDEAGVGIGHVSHITLVPRDMPVRGVPVIGDGADIMDGVTSEQRYPDPAAIARLGVRMYADEGGEMQGFCSPVYLRGAEVSVSKKPVRTIERSCG